MFCQCTDRIQVCGAADGIESEEDADGTIRSRHDCHFLEVCTLKSKSFFRFVLCAMLFLQGGSNMKQYIVDAFTDTLFKGNQVAVCVMDEWIPDGLI